EQDLQRKLDESGDDSMQRIADLRANAEERLSAVAETRRLYLVTWSALQAALVTRHNLCQDLAQVQDQIAGIRLRHNAYMELTVTDTCSWPKIAPFEHDEHADVDILADDGNRLNVLLDLQETPWDDYETILLDGTPVNEKSPGQRASAMLPLIALSEETPLV